MRRTLPLRSSATFAAAANKMPEIRPIPRHEETDEPVAPRARWSRSKTPAARHRAAFDLRS
jgi:hypothetical protein